MANERKGSNWIPVVVAVVCVAAFLGWLATREPPEAVVVTEPGDEASAPATPAEAPVAVVTADSLQNTAFVRSMAGQVIELQSVPVQTGMGSNFFWIELPNGQPFLVKMDSALIASGTAAPQSGSVNVVGVVTAKDNATLDQWRQSGVLESDDHRMQAEFGGSYIEARRVQPAGN